MQPLLTFTSDTLTIRPWPDEVIDQLGFDARSPYVERFWLGVLGPSTTWLLRRLAAEFDEQPDGFELPLGDTARAIGLGERAGRHSPFLRSVNRILQFDLGQIDPVAPTGTARATHHDAIRSGAAQPDLPLPSPQPALLVRRKLPPLSRRQIIRLSPALQHEHARWQEAERRELPAEAQRRRGRQLALSLVQLGEDAEEAERQLLRWRYHPAMAREAAVWAWDQHRSAMADSQAG